MRVTAEIPQDVSESFVGGKSTGMMGNKLSIVSSEVGFATKAVSLTGGKMAKRPFFS